MVNSPSITGLDLLAEAGWQSRQLDLGEVEVPSSWSDQAAAIVASRYLRRPPGGERETSVRQMFGRVLAKLVSWGRQGGYFVDEQAADEFSVHLASLLVGQVGSFNSPVWFNLGIEDEPLCASTLILSVADSTESILELARTEGLVAKHGAGTGTNFSALRAAGAPIRASGKAAGVVSFLRGLDAMAGTFKAGGKTRRAARMVVLDGDHPEVVAFVRAKAEEEQKAWALVAAGFNSRFDADDGAYGTVGFQHANHSVRMGDSMLTAALAGSPRASELMAEIAAAAWLCGDPGMQYDNTINSWHTCPAAGPIRASNSCSEFLFLDDTACPLASLNLMKLRNVDGGFDASACRRAAGLMVTALDLMIDEAGYPHPLVAERSRRFRPVGLGFANLGAFLMANGLPYDSDAGRHLTAAVTALLTGSAWVQSARLAERLGPFAEFEANRAPLLAVLERHRAALGGIDRTLVPAGLLAAAVSAWDEVLVLARRFGVRNAQVSAIAPTGTLSLVMDCDTSGIEPDFSLIKSKTLSGGGELSLVNRSVGEALGKLGYGPVRSQRILDHLEEHGSVERAADLEPRHRPVFDCAVPARPGGRALSPTSHLRMMAAVQPFVCGGISKTVNLPEHTTPDEVRDIFVRGWKLGLKAVAIYRDGCKRSQPLAPG